MAYSGYLSPHADFIRDLASLGNDARTIAGILYADGVRSPYWRTYWEVDDHIAVMSATVAYVLRGGDKKKPKAPAAVKPQRVTIVMQDWQVWTPEMQEAEFQMGYSH